MSIAPAFDEARHLEAISILLVEDHVDSANATGVLLRRCGYTVHVAGTAAHALAISSNCKLDLVICDIGLPDGNGYDVMQQLNSRFGISGIALSGYDDFKHDALSRAAGFVEFLLKPIDISRLLISITSIASMEKRRRIAIH